MVKIPITQKAFSAGEISPYLHNRSDMEVWHGAVASLVNFIPDQFGNLHRRPGTKFIQSVDEKPCFYNFNASVDEPSVIVATPNKFAFYVDGEKISEVDVPYGADDYCDLQMVDDCGATFIVHKDYPPRFIQNIDGEFELKEFPRLPYGDLNSDESCKLCLKAGGTGASGSMTITSDEWATGDSVNIIDVNGADMGTAILGEYLGANTFETDFITGIASGEYFDQDGNKIKVASYGAVLEAIGCEPFTDKMVGQYIRVLDEDGACQFSEISETVSYVVNSDGNGGYDLTDGVYVENSSGSGGYDKETLTTSEISETKNDPNTWLSLQIVAFTSEGEVVVAYSGCELKCTDLFCPPAYADGEYPSSAWIYQDRLWLSNKNCFVASKTGNFFDWEKTDPDGTVNPDNAVYDKINSGACAEIKWMRAVGGYMAIGTDQGVYAYGSDGVISASGNAQQLVQSVGASDISPLSVSDQLLFVDKSRTRIFSVAPGVQYNQLSSIEQSIFVDHIVEKRIAHMSFHARPFPIIWVVTDDGCLSSFTFWPGQGVRGWARHELGGQLIKNGCCVKPEICDVSSQVSSDGATDITYFAVKRTIAGNEVILIETIDEFYSHGSRKEDARFLDASTRLMNVADDVPSGNWLAQSVAFSSDYSGRVAVCDNERWYYGDSDGENISFDAPNTTCVEYGRTMQEIDGEYVLIEKPKYGDKGVYVDETACLFNPPCNPNEVVLGVSSDVPSIFNGETFAIYADGLDCGCAEVINGSIASGSIIGLVGYPYASEVEPMAWRANLGASDGSNSTSRVTKVSVNVYHTGDIFAVSKLRDRVSRTLEKCVNLNCEPSKDIYGVALFTGGLSSDFSTEFARNDRSQVTIRVNGVFPATIRGITITHEIQEER